MKLFEVDTIVRLKKTGEFAIIQDVVFLMNEQNFLHYHGYIEGREGLYALYHQDLELECLPKPKKE